MRKFWIFLAILFAIVFGIAIGCAVWPDSFRPWFINGVVTIFGETGRTFTGWWSGVMATPFYLQWHPFIWIGGTIILVAIWAKVLWPRRPRWKAVPTLPKIHQHRIETELPHAVSEPVPKAVAKTEPKKEVKTEEAVAT